MSNKCLVIGGNGFIGGAIARRLVECGDSTKIMDKSCPNLKNIGDIINSVEYIEKDFFNEEEMTKAIVDVECIFHCISSTFPGTFNNNPIYDVETNVIGTLRLLNAIKNKNIKIIFVSSGGTVYGEANKTPINEEHSTNPICSYGIAKLMIEKYIFMYNKLYDLDCCIFRLSNPYGEKQNPLTGCGLISSVLYKTLHNQTIDIRGDGGAKRDYIYINDVVDAMFCVKNYKTNNILYNLGSGISYSINEVIDIIRNITKKEIVLNYTNKREFDINNNCLDIGLIKQDLHWKPKVNICEGIENVWSYFEKEHGN